jgi:hypothetical protein
MLESLSTMSGSFFQCAKASAPRREAFSDAQKLQHHVGKLFPMHKSFSTTSGSFSILQKPQHRGGNLFLLPILIIIRV